MKSEEVGALREATLTENREVLIEAAAALRGAARRRRAPAGVRQRRLCHGRDGRGRRLPPAAARLAGRAALDLTEDTSIITAIANDVGVEEIFQRQVIAYGREGDAALALSTSGGSDNVILALAEARKRGLLTIAFVGYDGGRIAVRGAGRPCDRDPLPAHPPHPGGAGGRVPRPPRAGRASGRLTADRRRVRVRVRGTVQGVGFRPFVFRVASELGLDGWVLNDEQGVVDRGAGPASRDRRAGAPPLRRRAAARRGRIGGGDGCAASPRTAGSGSPTRSAEASPRRWSRPTWRPARTAWPSSSTRPIAAIATRSSTARTAARGSRSSAGSPTTGR